MKCTDTKTESEFEDRFILPKVTRSLAKNVRKVISVEIERIDKALRSKFLNKDSK
jgi:hypothetical protein